MNSTGVGGLLTATGSSSVSIDDLRLHITNIKGNANARMLIGPTKTVLPFGDGIQCVGSNGLFTTGLIKFPASGARSFGPGLIGMSCAPGGPPCFQAGQTLHFQLTYHDIVAPTNCGNRVNYTNAVEITFVP